LKDRHVPLPLRFAVRVPGPRQRTGAYAGQSLLSFNDPVRALHRPGPRDLPSGLVQRTGAYAGQSREEAFVKKRLGDFDGCTRAESQVNVLIPTDMDPLLVERVAIGDIQTFIAEFNADRTDIQILFEYPISVSAVIRVTLLGVEGTADILEKEVIENTFRQICAPILQANDPTFTLSTVVPKRKARP
jgi:hypothetical protein